MLHSRTLVGGITPFLLLAGLISPPPSLQGQHHEPGGISQAPPAGTIGGIPEEVVRRPIPLRDDLAIVHHPVRSGSERARAFHDQGLTYLHLYGHLNAARSFHAALRLDPELAASHAGLAMAYVGLGDPERALEVLDVAEAHAVRAGETERAWVRSQSALARLHANAGGNGEELLAEIRGGALLHPDDPELLLAAAAVSRGPDRVELLERVLELEPDHVGAHHLLVHTHEESRETLERAVAHGAELSRLAPSVAHGRHMYGHNLRRVGRAAEAIVEFEAAREIELRTEREEGISVRYDWHHPHNLALLAMSRHHQGRIREAEHAFRELVVLPAKGGHVPLGRRMNLMELYLALGRWDAALAEAEELLGASDPTRRAAGRLAAALAHLGLGDQDTARRLWQEARAEFPDGRNPFGFHQEAVRILLAAGPENGSEAGSRVETTSRLAEVLDGLTRRDGPDAWSEAHARMEILAAAAASGAQWDLVAKVADKLVEHDPKYAGGFYWRAKSAEASGDEAGARDAAGIASALWPNADADFPRLGGISARGEATRADEAAGPAGEDAEGAAPSRGDTGAGLAAVPVVRAARTEEAIVIDGTLDEAGWAEADVITGFLQSEPREGEPATEPTEVRILYDSEALYLSARLHDSEAPRSRVARRDSRLLDSDWFSVSLDSNRDGMTAVRFRVNPDGVRGDESLDRSGRADAAWNPVWEAAASVDDGGWTVEMRIPFSQLRRSGDGDGAWGIQVERTLRRNDEVSVLSFTPRRAAGGIARFGLLEGIGRVDPGGRVELQPHVVGRASTGTAGAPGGGSHSAADLGMDIRYRITPAFTLDLAASPDFGQVEVDPAQVNLSAFELWFPENRPFFVEGADLFRPVYGKWIAPSMFYSRRIGAAPQGRVPLGAVTEARLDPVPIVGAGKLTGRTEEGWSVGVMGALTDRVEADYEDPEGAPATAILEPRTTFAAGSIRRELREGGTTVGAMATAVRRDGTDVSELSHLNDAGYAASLNFRHEWADRRWQLTGELQSSRVEGRPEAITTIQRASTRAFQRPDAAHLTLDSAATSLTGWAADVSVSRQAGERWRGSMHVGAVSPGHEVNDLGFQTMADRTTAAAEIQYREDQPGEHFQRWNVTASGMGQRNFAGDVVGASGVLHFNSLLRNRSSVLVQVMREGRVLDDRLTRGGPLSRTPGRSLAFALVRSDTRRAVTGEVMAEAVRDDDGGAHLGLRGGMTVQPAPRWSFGLSPAVSRTTTRAHFLGAVPDPAADHTYGARYLFGSLDQRTAELGARLDLALRPNLTLELRTRALVSGGSFGDPGELARPGTRTIHRYGSDLGEVEETDEGFRIHPGGQSGEEAGSFLIPARDFTFRSLRGGAVLRWDWHRGSSLFVVWQQDRSASLDAADFRMGRGLKALGGLPGSHAFQIKASYWLNP
jgi:tetratricopeptide (TPR) repeat protein